MTVAGVEGVYASPVQVDWSHDVRHRARYVVGIEGAGIITSFPVANGVPLQKSRNHSSVSPEPPSACSTIGSPGHAIGGVAVTPVGAMGRASEVTVLEKHVDAPHPLRRCAE